MKNFFLFAFAALLLVSCDKDEQTTDSSFAMKSTSASYDDQCTKPRVVVSGDLTAANGPHVWDNDHVWVISGVVRVKTTLQIEAGTYIVADPTVTTGANGVLAVTKAGSIDAQGTIEAPIVFTSWKLLDCDDATVPAAGDFGGVVLLGEANVNNGLTTNIIEGLGDQTNVTDFYYGGTNDADNSGIMKFVRIEYAGRILNALTGVEINGLTFGGVGSGTVIDYIQVSFGRDDSFEWFGGTVNASHLVAFANDDDGFDFDLGYTGSVTKAIAIANTASTHSTSSSSPDSNGIELDNNAGGTTTTIITRPTVTDLSIVGFKNATDAAVLENGIHVRRLGQISLTRATSTGYGAGTGTFAAGLRWDVDPTLSAKSTLSVHGFTNVVLPAAGGTYTSAQLLGLLANTSTAGSAPTWSTSTTYQPFFNEPNFSLSGGTTGAFATEANWTATWTKFNL